MVGLLTFTSDGFTLPDRSCLVSGPFSVGDDTRLAADKVPGKVKNLCKECCLVTGQSILRDISVQARKEKNRTDLED
ncbi:hypothetical protein RRG08_037632 [Elysia crispata]|uniref:Uncharacterized protein n=1 Tax=Elysia crispata TaxID=231223 RepID=A0AAE0YGL2_9GAST|nr:hypothetical protein RRG08_037632 [Elysia crispata]